MTLLRPGGAARFALFGHRYALDGWVTVCRLLNLEGRKTPPGAVAGTLKVGCTLAIRKPGQAEERWKRDDQKRTSSPEGSDPECRYSRGGARQVWGLGPHRSNSDLMDARRNSQATPKPSAV